MSDHPHIDPLSGIEDVELEDDEIDEKSYEELVKERRQNDAEALQSYRDATPDDSEEESSSEVEKSDTESLSESVVVDDPKTDGELIKRTGVAMMDVDVTDPDDEAMRDLIQQKREGKDEIGFESEEKSIDPVLDSIQNGTHEVREEFEKEAPLPEMEPTEQAAALAKEAQADLNIDSIVEEAADLPKSASSVRDQVYEKVYGDITKFVRTIYSESEINTQVLKTVRDKIATDAANRAMVRRKANEDGVTVDSPNYNPDTDGEEAVDEEVQEASEDGGQTDAPEGEGDDVDLSDEDMDLQG